MTRKEVTETELAILEVLWDRGAVTVREIVDAVYGEYRRSLHMAVKSLLDRLGDKGFVDVDTSQYAHCFSARVSRSEFVGRQLQSIVMEHFGGAVSPMLHALVDHTKLSRKDRDAIRRIIEETEK